MRRHHPGWALALFAALVAATCLQPACAQNPPSGTALPAAAPPGAQPLSAPQLPPDPPFVGHAPYAPEALVTDTLPAQRSVVFDKPKARALNASQEPAYITRIDVKAAPDPAPPVKTKNFEQRFADALAPPVSFLSRHSYSNSTEPCPALASAGTPFTQSYNVYGYCP